MPRILVVDDELSIRKAISIALRNAGYDVDEAHSRADAIEKIGSASYDLVLTDLFIPFEDDGIEIVSFARGKQPAVLLMMMTGHGTIERAVQAMRAGADDFLAKGFVMEELLFRIERLFDQRAMKRERDALASENKRMQSELERRNRFENIVGESAPMQRLFSLLDRIAAERDATVLIEGESGTGKELVARAIHYHGPRKEKPFVVVNCAALPEHLLESELFGHVKGAFTGALKDKQGKFELADGGTLFLDEIGEISAKLQVELLRFTQDRVIERVGSATTMQLDVRIIAATNKRLEQEVAAGKFREDLFYRLNVLPVTLPPLRERRDDVPRLVDHFLVAHSDPSKPRLRISPEAMRHFERHTWRGNVRELENVIQRLTVTATGEVVQPFDLPTSMIESGEQRAFEDAFKKQSLADACERFESAFIAFHLERHHWNVTETAEAIGERRDTLSKKIARYGLKQNSADRNQEPESRR